MRFSTFIVCAFAALASPAQAFSNGGILPSYFCGLNNDGLPKTVGGVIGYFEPDHIPDRGYPIAGYHHQKIVNSTNIMDPANGASLIPKNNTLMVNPTMNFNAIDLANANTGPRRVYPGQEIALDLISRNAAGIVNLDILQAPGSGNGTVASVFGAFVYAVDQNGVRIGRFTAFGTPGDDTGLMQPWDACGPNAVGIVHNAILNETGSKANYTNPLSGGMPIFTGIKWKAPATLKVGSTITFQGFAVTGFGYGVHSTDFTVVAAPAGVPSTPNITNTFVFGNNVAVFFTSSIAANTLTYTASVTQGGMTNKFTSNTSPVIVQFKNQVGAGDATITIMASSTDGMSNTSNTKIVSPSTQPQVPSQLFTQLNALCPDKRFAYSDEENQCSWTSQAASANLVFNIFTNTTVITNTTYITNTTIIYKDKIINGASTISTASTLSMAVILVVTMMASKFVL